MKEIQNKKTEITENRIKFQGDENKKVSYSDLLSIVLDIVPQGGFTPTDIHNRMRIKNQLNNNTDKVVIKLEDADYKNLVALINISRWPFYDAELEEFLNNFKY